MPAGKLYHTLLQFDNFKKIMPDSVNRFAADEESFTFGLKGMPEVKLRLAEQKEPEKILLRSGSDKLEFSLQMEIKTVDEDTSELQFRFEGDFNPMVKMMVERPLRRFMDDLAEKVGQL